MHGNVWEYCADSFSQEYSSQSPLENPTGPRSGTLKVFRGGGYPSSATRCRSANRGGVPVDDRSLFVGFRVVREMNSVPKSESDL
jgi:formylglycine-generating enzyme required for sulfatase activity